MKIWKLLGLAGAAGITATGALIVIRSHRERTAYTPEEIRTRLQSRAADASKPG
jgi:hypothetical protein